MQRCLAANFDEELRTPGGKELPREEAACVVCARRFWKHELVLLRLFQDPEGELPRKMLRSIRLCQGASMDEGTVWASNI